MNGNILEKYYKFVNIMNFLWYKRIWLSREVPFLAFCFMAIINKSLQLGMCQDADLKLNNT
jgi:hypothetical protein